VPRWVQILAPGDFGHHLIAGMQQVQHRVQIPPHRIEQFRTAEPGRHHDEGAVADAVVDGGAALSVLAVRIDIDALGQPLIDYAACRPPRATGRFTWASAELTTQRWFGVWTPPFAIPLAARVRNGRNISSMSCRAYRRATDAASATVHTTNPVSGG